MCNWHCLGSHTGCIEMALSHGHTDKLTWKSDTLDTKGFYSPGVDVQIHSSSIRVSPQ